MIVSAGSGPLLGRDGEVAQALQVLTGESGGYVAVVGAAGIGKSAVVHETAARATRTGLAVRATSGAVSETDLPFLGLHDLIGADVAAVDLPPVLREPLEAVLRRADGGASGVDPLAVDLAVLRVVEQLSTDRRLLLVLDDLPWVDAATRAALNFVLRRVRPERLSVLAAMRPDADVTDLLPPAVRSIPVRPLDAPTLAAVVELRTGAKLTHRAERLLHELSGGNPLLALELARTAAVDQDALAETTVPERYRHILVPRVTELSADARRALLAAALLARPTLAELADVVSVAGLLEADDAGVVRIEAGRVVFTHPLYAALCRDLARGGERRDLHALLAKAARDEIERARHLGSATLLPDEDVAARIEEAAAVARGRAALATAAELAVLAQRLTPPEDAERRTARGCLAAELFFGTGDVETASGTLAPLLDELPPGPLRARCLALLAQVLSEDSERSVELLEEALGQPGLDPEVEDDLRLDWAVLHINLGDMATVRDRCAELEARAAATNRVVLARKARLQLAFAEVATGTPPARSRAWAQMVDDVPPYGLAYDHPDLLQAWLAMAAEEHQRAGELIDGLMEQARLADNLLLWGSLAVHRSEVELRRGRIGPARELIDQAYRIRADGRHDESLLSYRALVEDWQGQLDQARAEATEALEMATRDRNQIYVLYGHLALGNIAISEGRPADAAEHFAAVHDRYAGTGLRHPSLAAWQGGAVEALVAAGRRDEAVAIIEELEALAETYDLDGCRALAARCRGILLADDGDLDAAVAAFDDSLRLAERFEIPLEHARTLLARGVVQRRRRQKARSREDLRRAHDLFAECGAVLWAARAERELERSAAIAAGAELTSSERVVAARAASGATNREIAAALYLSEKTVEAVLTRVYRKLAVRSRTQLAQHPVLDVRGEGTG